MSSSSIILVYSKTTNYFHKVLYDKDSQIAIMNLSAMLADTVPNGFVKPEILVRTPFLHYRYPGAKYGKLKREEALSCLQELVRGIFRALDEVHKLGLSHNDIRLPNVCFNDKFEVVLIDFERAYGVEQLSPFYLEEVTSCMYRVSMKKITSGITSDCAQVGWLIAYIMDPSCENERGRKWSTMTNEMKENPLIKLLIEDGLYDPDLLYQLPGSESIADVILKR